jgi:hypothetical protein
MQPPEPVPQSNRVSWTLLLFLLLPVLVHAGLMAYSTLTQADQIVYFQPLDLALFLVVLAYLSLGLILVARARAWAVRYLLVVYSTLIGLGAANVLAWRLLPPASPEQLPLDPGHWTGTVADDVPGLSGKTYEMSINSIGLRGPEVPLDQVDFRILCVGGSTCACLLVSDQQTWPWQLQDKLAERTGKSIFVGNAGRSGALSTQHKYLLEHYAYVPEFDWVVVLCGANDFMDELQGKGRFERYAASVAADALTPKQENQFYYHDLSLTRLLKRVHAYAFTHAFVQDDSGKWVEQLRQQRREGIQQGKVTNKLSREFLDWACSVYRKNLGEIIDVCRGQDPPCNLLMLTQPSMHRKDLPPDLERWLFTWTDQHGNYLCVAAMAQGINALNQTMLDLSRERGVDCIDLASMLPKNTQTFYDDWHYNNEGCARIADILCKYFEPKVRNANRGAAK